MILALVLLAVLGVSFLFNLQHMASGFIPGGTSRYYHTVGPKLEEVLIEDTPVSDKIAVIEVRGIISSQMPGPGGFGMVDIIKAELKRAAEDQRVKAVVLDINTPGGEVLASDEISRLVSDFQEKSSKPVVAAMRDLATSGGYYVSAPCRWIVANELTLTGSIGVIMSTWNYRHLMDKVGIVPQVYKSGEHKDMLSGTRNPEQVTPEERAMLEGLIKQTFSKFKSVVAAGRENADRLNEEGGRKLRQDWVQFADGRILSGRDAFELGFVDELGSFQDAVRRACLLVGVARADVVKYQPRYDFGDFLRLFGRSEPQELKVDLGFDPPRLQAGKLYFLPSTFLQ